MRLARAAPVGVGSVQHGAKLEKSLFCQGRMSRTSCISSARKRFLKDILLFLGVRDIVQPLTELKKDRTANRVGLSSGRYFSDSAWLG